MPSVTLRKNTTITTDTYIVQSSPQSSYGNSSSLQVGTSGVAGTARRALIFFDLGQIPNDAIISYASLDFDVSSGASGVPSGIYKVTSQWDKNVTWNTQPSIDSRKYESFSTSALGSFSVSIKDLVQEWVNGAPNHGLMIKADDENSAPSYSISSFEEITAGSQPELTIGYTIPTTGKKQVEYVGSGSTSGTGTSIVANLPASAQQGDLLVALVNYNTTSVINFPADWTVVANDTAGPDKLGVAYKFMQAGEPKPTFSGGTNANWAIVIYAFRNVKAVQKSAKNVYTDATTKFSISAQAATTDKVLKVLLNMTTYPGSVTFTPPLSYNERYAGSPNVNYGCFEMAHRYLHNLKTASEIGTDVTTLSLNTVGLTSYLMLEPIVNNPPTLTLTSPADNQTLTEGKTYTISGSATDTNNGNVVTIKYKINNGTARAINSGVSDGSTPIAFSKNLTYRNKRLWDGSTDVVGYDLAEGTNHTLYVWAEDDQGGKSPDTTRSFTVIWNRPPVISGTDKNLGTISASPSQDFSVTDPEGNPFTIEYYLDDQRFNSFPGVSGQTYTVSLTNDQWIRTSLAQHKLKVRAIDNQGAYSDRVYTFTRTDDRIEFKLNYSNDNVKNFFTTNQKANRILVTLDATIPSGATLLVEACNNAYDAQPTWEDITSQVKAQRGYQFTNTTSTSGKWGINIHFKIEKGTATETVLLNGFGGAFD